MPTQHAPIQPKPTHGLPGSMAHLRRNDLVIGAIGVFIAWGYTTHWFPSLRWIPQAFIAGLLTAIALLLCALTVSRPRGHALSEEKLRSHELYGPRTAAFILPGKWDKEVAALRKRMEHVKEPLYPNSLVISDALDGLLEYALRDFVESWYSKISPRPSFTNQVDRAIRAALGNIIDRLVEVDLVEVAVSRLVPLITKHLRDFDEAERIVRGRNRGLTESEELDLAIAGRYNGGNLHPAASLAYSNTKMVQQQHLRAVVTRLLPKVLPREMTTSPAVTVLIKEIVACAVIFPVVQMLEDPDTWNQLLEGYGRTVLQDRKTVRKLRAKLDEHAPVNPKNTRTMQFPKLNPGDGERKFERLLRAIKQCNSLSDARRFRSEIASQLRKDSAIEGQDLLYLRRLEYAKKMLDQRVAKLGSGAPTKNMASASQRPGTLSRRGSRWENATLRQVLYDASGLSYFMEFMDRQNGIRMIQFWLVVDGFRNPLEEDTDEPEDLTAIPSWTDSERTDLAQINEAYLSQPELKISPEARRAVKNFLKAGKDATPAQYQAARRAVLQSQTAVYNELEKHFQNFKKSDLYFKWLASDEAASATASPSLSSDELIESSSVAVPPKLSRHAAKNSLQAPSDLRRQVVSSSNLRDFVRPVEADAPVRRSLDGPMKRTPLFDDDYDSDPLARSTQSLESVGDQRRTADGNNKKIVDAMHEALNEIMEDGPDHDSVFSDREPSLRSPTDNDSLRDSLEFGNATSSNPESQVRPPLLSKSSSVKSRKEKPSIASLGLVGMPNRSSVFVDDDLFSDDQEKFIEDEIDDSDDAKDDTDEDEIHEAAPGDLGLAEAIDALTVDIDRLVTQEEIVDSLTKKAELTNNAAELRILRKSKASLQRELRRKELQRQQYIIQESDNGLYGRATVSIQRIMVGHEEDGKQFALYVIEVRRSAGESMPAAAWVVTRRYSEFHALNKRLRESYPEVRNLEFPSRVQFPKLLKEKEFLEKRRVALEKYLRQLLLIPAICRSRELRAFLSQSPLASSSPANQASNTRDFVTRIYNSVTDGMEEFLGNIPVLDQLSSAGQNLISAATSQLAVQAVNANASTAGLPAFSSTAADASAAAEAEAELRAFDPRGQGSGELGPFVKPICDLFLETFGLNREGNWLRGRAVVVVLHQLLGGTVERKVREAVKGLTSEDGILKYISMLRDIMWPGGKLKPPSVPRTPADKAKARKEATILLAALVPELVGSVVGRANAAGAARRLSAALNNGRLNTHLVFTLLDEVLKVLFGEEVVAAARR